MNELRWILLGFAIALLAGIYLWGRRGSREREQVEGPMRVRAEPALALESEPSIAPEDDADPSFGAPVGGARAQVGRIEPTLDIEAPTEEASVQPLEPPVAAPSSPTPSSSEAPQPRRIERRKILAVRLAAAPHRIDGAKLLQALREEGLEHGKYDVFHRMHDGAASLFSVASMVEPGTFDLDEMAQMQYPGLTLFAQLPGPAPGMHALNELIACARKLQQALGGTLQDDRGVPLTVHRIERMRQEVREFERPSGGGRSAAHLSHSAPSA
ncbi:MAG: cell division protein ZipA C-terminal FtsZ-binding domain-containing protein [Steroidobacteraceae bacterium]|jgi:cell division protein ZipA|nr:cell division protein ZipA C-terminal FtsZ-binding domain-containing protein [Steroidobacteraceae bacterium]